MASSKDIAGLEAAVRNFALALQQTKAALVSNETVPNEAIDPLSLAKDSALLVKSHTTKLALLLRTEPFTPSAIARELNSLVVVCTTGLLSAYQLCNASTWSSSLRKELKTEISSLIYRLAELPDKVHNFKIVSGSSVASADEKTLQATGRIWDTCDKLVALHSTGLSGILLKRCVQQRELVQDAIEELEEWMETPEPVDDEGFVEGFEEPGADLLTFLPKNDAALRDQLVLTLKRLKLIILLFQAIAKRRFSAQISATSSGYTPDQARQGDELMSTMRGISESADNIAAAFYDLDRLAAATQLEDCLVKARSVASSLEKTWTGGEDQCTAWLKKWQDQVQSA